MSSVPGTTQQLLSLVEAKEVSQDERAGRLTPADDGGSSHLASLAAPVDDIEDEMAADTAKKGAFKVFATGGGFYSFLLSLLLVGVFSAMPGIIPIYVQVSCQGGWRAGCAAACSNRPLYAAGMDNHGPKGSKSHGGLSGRLVSDFYPQYRSARAVSASKATEKFHSEYSHCHTVSPSKWPMPFSSCWESATRS